MIATKKVKSIYVNYEFVYPRCYKDCKSNLALGFQIYAFTGKQNSCPLFNFFYYYEDCILRDISDNVSIVLDDIKRFILLKGFIFTDKTEKAVSDILYDCFNGHSKNFLINERIVIDEF